MNTDTIDTVPEAMSQIRACQKSFFMLPRSLKNYSIDSDPDNYCSWAGMTEPSEDSLFF